MKRFFIPLAALFSLVAPALTRAAPPIYPGVVPYEQLDTRNFYLGNYPILRIMPFMPKDTPPYLPVDTWSFAVNTNLWTLYAYDPPNTTWHQVLGLGGIAVTINPTDTVMPYRVDATTFGDSPWSVPGAGQAYADGANAFLHLDLATGNSSYHTTTPNSTLAIYPQMLMEQVPAMGDTVSTTTMAEGMLISNPTPSTAAAPENSPSMYWGGSAWSTNGAASTPMAFAAVVVPRNAANIPTAYWSLFSSVSNRPPTLEFTVKEGSGYAGGGTKVLTDDGTYKAGGTVGLTINPTDGYVPYRTSATTFGDSPWYRMDTNKVGFAGYTNVWLEWCPDGVGLDYAVLGMGDGVFGLIDPNSTQFAAGSVGVGTRAFGAAMDARSSVALGYEAGNYATNVQGSVLIGYAVGGPDNIIDTTIVGSSAGPGSLSVTNSTYVGSSAGAQMRGSFNTTVGAFAGYTGGVNDNTNQISIGASSAVTNSNDIVIGNSNNARLIVPITSWTGTGSKVLTDNGTYQTASSVITGAISSQLLWTNSPTGGGSLTASSNVIASLPTGLYGSIFNNSEDIFAAGENAGQGQAVIQSTNLYNIGLLSGYGMTGNEAWMVMNIGDAAGRSATIYNSQDVYNFGIAPGELSQITNGSWVVMNIGDNAGYAMVTDKAQDIFNYGWLSGDSMGVSNSIAIFNYGDWAGKNPVSTIQNSQDIFNYGNAAGGDQIPQNSTNLFNYGLYAGGAQFVQTVNSYYNYGTDSGYMGVGLASNSEELYNYGAWAGASLAALVADGTFVNFTNVYNYGPEAGMQIKGTNATYVLNYGYRAGEQSTMTGVSDLYNYGSDSGFQSTYDTSATDIYNYGTSAGKGASYTNSFFILNSGNSAGQSMVAQDSSSILNLGSYAGANMVSSNSTDLVNIGSYAGNLSALTNSTHVYTWGYQAGRLLAGDGYTNIYLFGTAQPTRKTNEFVFGSANDQVTVPGNASVASLTIGTNTIAGRSGSPNSPLWNGSSWPESPFSSQVPSSGLSYAFDADTIAAGHLSSVSSWIDVVSGVTMTSTNPPTLIRNAADGHSALRFDGIDTSKGMDFPASISVNSQSFTAVAVMRLLVDGLNVLPFCFGASGNYWFGIAGNGSGYTYYNDTPFSWTSAGYKYSTDMLHVGWNIVFVSGSTTNYSITVNRNTTNFTQLASATWTGGFMGYYKPTGTLAVQQDFAQFLIYDHALTPAEMDAIQTAFEIEFKKSATSQFVILGNSIGAGYNSGKTNTTTLQGYLRDALPSSCDIVNVSRSGFKTINLLTNLNVWLNLYDPALAKNSVLVWEGINDLASGASVSQATANLTNLCAGMRTNGWYTYVGTILPSPTIGVDADRQAVNSNIVQMVANGYADAVVDFAAVPVLSAMGADVSSDGTHLNAYGFQLASDAVVKSIRAFKPVTSDILFTGTVLANTAIGIGTNATSEKLEVLGNVKASGKALLKGGVQDGYTNVLTSATGKDFFYVSVPNTNGIGGHVVYTVFCTDGTDVQEISGDVKFASVAKGTTVTATTADVQSPAALTGGSTLTAALAANTSTNNVFALGVTATTSLTSTNLVIKWRVETPSTFTVNAIP